jgi:hypothetical protein
VWLKVRSKRFDIVNIRKIDMENSETVSPAPVAFSCLELLGVEGYSTQQEAARFLKPFLKDFSNSGPRLCLADWFDERGIKHRIRDYEDDNLYKREVNDSHCFVYELNFLQWLYGKNNERKFYLISLPHSIHGRYWIANNWKTGRYHGVMRRLDIIEFI